MVTGKRTATLALLLLSCLLLTACGAQRFITIQTERASLTPISDEIKKICIIGVSDPPGRPGTGALVRDALLRKLQESKRYELVEREEMRLIQAERMLDLAGVTAEKDVLENDVFADVDAIILGGISNYRWVTKSFQEQETYYEQVPYTYHVPNPAGGGSIPMTGYNSVARQRWVTMHTADGGVDCTFRMVDKKRGNIIAVKPCTKSWSFGKKKTAPPAESAIMSQLVDQAAEEFRMEIAPWVHVERLELKYRTFSHFEPGRQWAEKGLFNDAIEFFRNGAEAEPEDMIMHYNLGLCYEAMGMYEEALKSIETAFKLEPTDNEIIAAKKRLVVKIKDFKDGKIITPLVPVSST
ncbi:MAG: tetratricopeptide repeat protein [Planctomycetota bacterium]|nr:MAG: tetratricopeptide repeat protein [Planctomycetota bacterium]